jgi:outer membrane protein insertion porin family
LNSLRRKLSTGILLAVSLLAAAPIALSANSSDLMGRRVVSVEVILDGAPGGDTAEMRELLEIAAGQDYSPVRIHDALGRLYRSGLVSGARVEGDPVGADGVALRFIVKPQPRVEAVTFAGNPIFPAAELRAHLNELDLRQRLTAGLVARGTSDLQSFYVSRGYYQAVISADTTLDPTGIRATVIYTISLGEPARVSKLTIAISGPRIDLSAIKPVMEEGKIFSQTDLQDEMDRIRQACLQENYLAVQVDSAVTRIAEENAVAVSITVDPGPKLSVQVQGLELSDKTIRQVFPFYAQGGVDDFSLEEGRRRLLDYAQRQGYFFAEVTKPGTPSLSATSANLDYVVEPGQRYKLSSIDIKGVTALPKQPLKDQLKSKESWFMPFVASRQGLTSEDLLRQDVNTIQKELRNVGYRHARVEALRGVSLDGKNLIITFDVQEGPRTFIEEVEIKGNDVLSSEQLTGKLKVKPGDPYVKDAVDKSSDVLAAEYSTRGFADAEVVTEVTELGNTSGQDRVRLVYNVTEGNRVRVLHVTTNGTAYADQGRLARDFYFFKAGDWLRNDRVQDTERVLYDTNAFSSVTIHSDTVAREPGGIEDRDVTVDLAEAKRYLLVYGLGYQNRSGNPTVPGLGFLHGGRGLIQLTNTDMFGKLDTGSILLRVAQDELFGQVSFQNPRPFGLHYPVLVSIFGQRLADVSFKSDRYTASIQAERRLSANSIFYLSYNLDLIRNYDLKVSEAEIARSRQAVRLGRIIPSYLRDTRDSAFDPHKGTLTTGSVQLAATIFGGNEDYVKTVFEHDRYYPVPHFRDVVYSVSGRLGLATPFGGKTSLPISERFFAGGPRDLRGFGFELAGPLDPVTGLPVGGNALIVLNNELRFPLYKILGGAVFSDTGNVFASVRDVKVSGLSQTLGFGFRIKTPIGPLRADMGFLVANKPVSERDYRVHFSFGQTF